MNRDIKHTNREYVRLRDSGKLYDKKGKLKKQKNYHDNNRNGITKEPCFKVLDATKVRIVHFSTS